MARKLPTTPSADPGIKIVEASPVRKQQNANDASAGLNSTFSVSVQDARRHYEDFIDKLLSPFPGDNLAGESFRFTWVRWYGTSLPRVWPAILFWTVYATVIVLIAELGGYLTAIMAPSQAIVSLIGFAASLLLGFRTNSAYERWYEGRRLFETACSRVREVTRYWSSYFPPNTPAERAQQLNACRAGVAYVYALMYHLRGEDPLEHEDCTDLIPRTKDGNLAIETDNPETQRFYFEPAKSIIQISGIHKSGPQVNDMTSFRMPGTWRNPYTYCVPSQLLSLLLRYNSKIGATRFQVGLFSDLNNTQGALQRILSTPMPPIYSIHLKMVLTIFFIFLPFQFLSWGYFVIPITSVTAFTLWGFEAMGLELENPFGYDANDLPLSEICATLRREIDFIVEHPVALPDEWDETITPVSLDQLDKEIMMENDISIDEVRRTLKLIRRRSTVDGGTLNRPSYGVSSGVFSADRSPMKATINTINTIDRSQMSATTTVNRGAMIIPIPEFPEDEFATCGATIPTRVVVEPVLGAAVSEPATLVAASLSEVLVEPAALPVLSPEPANTEAASAAAPEQPITLDVTEDKMAEAVRAASGVLVAEEAEGLHMDLARPTAGDKSESVSSVTSPIVAPKVNGTNEIVGVEGLQIDGSLADAIVDLAGKPGCVETKKQDV